MQRHGTLCSPLRTQLRLQRLPQKRTEQQEQSPGQDPEAQTVFLSLPALPFCPFQAFGMINLFSVQVSLRFIHLKTQQLWPLQVENISFRFSLTQKTVMGIHQTTSTMRLLTLDHSQNPVYLSIQHAQSTFYHFHRQELGTLGNFRNYWHQDKKETGASHR